MTFVYASMRLQERKNLWVDLEGFVWFQEKIRDKENKEEKKKRREIVLFLYVWLERKLRRQKIKEKVFYLV